MLPRWLSGKESACSVRTTGDVGSIHGSGRSPGVGNSSPLRYSCMSFPGGSDGEESACNEGFNPWVGKIPWRRERLPTPVFLPGEFHGQRTLLGYSSWGCQESDITEWLTLSLSHALWFSLQRSKSWWSLLYIQLITELYSVTFLSCLTFLLGDI